jgi:hypothetical protein
MKTNAECCAKWRKKMKDRGTCIWGCGLKSSGRHGLCAECYKKSAEKIYNRRQPKYKRTGRHIDGVWVRTPKADAISTEGLKP